MAKIFLRKRQFSYIKTPEMKSPQIKGYEEIWQDDRGQVTYWDNEGVHRQTISAESKTKTSSVFHPLPMSDWLDRSEPFLSADSFGREEEGKKMRKVKIVSSQPSMREISASLRNWWQKTANQTNKLTRRLKSAWRAACQELTRP